MIRLRQLFALTLCFSLALPTALLAAASVHDLGQGLAYYRLIAVPADLPTTVTAACVLDLRYATSDVPAGDSLAAWLKSRVTPTKPVFILANADTSPALLRALAADQLPPGSLTLGLAAPGFSPDLPIRTTTESERRAYDAFATGTPLIDLVEEKITKPRHDEAEIVRRQAAREPLETEGDFPKIDSAAPAAVASAPLIDATLQRAVHLHRALLALRR